jgi:ParB-like chromosome segregation protein Spo0J
MAQRLKPRAAEGLVVRYVSIETIRPYERNSRTHTAKQIARLEASLARFGWTNPLLVADGDLLAGHARLTAATNIRDRGGVIARHADSRVVPTIDLSRLSASERRAYVIADNKLAEDAGWDNEMLRLELEGLKGDGFDLSLTGFTGAEVGTLLGEAGAAEGPQISGMRYQVVIECSDERHQAEILGDCGVRGLKARPLIL